MPLGRMPAPLAWLRAKRSIDRFQPDLVIHNEAVPIALPGVVVQAVNDLQRRRVSWPRCGAVFAASA